MSSPSRCVLLSFRMSRAGPSATNWPYAVNFRPCEVCWPSRPCSSNRATTVGSCTWWPPPYLRWCPVERRGFSTTANGRICGPTPVPAPCCSATTWTAPLGRGRRGLRRRGGVARSGAPGGSRHRRRVVAGLPARGSGARRRRRARLGRALPAGLGRVAGSWVPHRGGRSW